MACAVLLAIYISYELSYDRFRPEVARTYRVMKQTRHANGRIAWNTGQQGPLATVLPEEFPDVEDATTLLGWSQMDNRWGKIISTDVLAKRPQRIRILRHRTPDRRSPNRITSPIFRSYNRTHRAEIFWIHRSRRQNNHSRSQPVWRHISNHGLNTTSTRQLPVSIRFHHRHHATGRSPAQIVGSLVAASVLAPGKYVPAPEIRSQPRRHRPQIAGTRRTLRGNRRRRKRNRALLSPSRLAHALVFQSRYAWIYRRRGKTLQRHTANLSAGTRGILYPHNSLHQLHEPLHSPIRQPCERSGTPKSRGRVSLASHKAIPWRISPLICPIRLYSTRIGISRTASIQRICAGKPHPEQRIGPLDPGNHPLRRATIRKLSRILSLCIRTHDRFERRGNQSRISPGPCAKRTRHIAICHLDYINHRNHHCSRSDAIDPRKRPGI